MSRDDAQESCQSARRLIGELGDRSVDVMPSVFERMMAQLDAIMLLADAALRAGELDEDRFEQEVERIVATLHNVDAALVAGDQEQARQALSIAEQRLARLQNLVTPG